MEICKMSDFFLTVHLVTTSPGEIGLHPLWLDYKSGDSTGHTPHRSTEKPDFPPTSM